MIYTLNIICTVFCLKQRMIKMIKNKSTNYTHHLFVLISVSLLARITVIGRNFFSCKYIFKVNIH